MKTEVKLEPQGAPKLIVTPGEKPVVDMLNRRHVPAIDVHGFKVGLVADVKSPAALVIVGPDGVPLDIRPAAIPPGAMVAIVIPETAEKLRAGLPAFAKAMIPVY